MQANTHTYTVSIRCDRCDTHDEQVIVDDGTPVQGPTCWVGWGRVETFPYEFGRMSNMVVTADLCPACLADTNHWIGIKS
jgi:hypothetical protein